MKLGKTICLVILSIFAIASLSYAYAAMVNLAPDTTGQGTTQAVEKAVTDAQAPIDAAKADDTRTKGDKGSPMHAWKAIVAGTQTVPGKKAGDFITTEEFAQLRNWSSRTRGYELQSLVAIGVLSQNDKDGKALKRGTYRVVVDATPEQIDRINERVAKTIVNKTGVDGAALGIDSYRLDGKYIGSDKVGQIADVVREITGTAEVAIAEVPADLVQADIDAGRDVPVSAAINGDIPFTINGMNLQDRGVTNAIEQQAVLAALVDMRLVEPQAQVAGVSADFKQTKVEAVLFKGEFVTSDPEDFNRAYQEQVANDPNKIAVIISTSGDQMETAIKAALEKVELLGVWGDKIIVMGVRPGSAAAVAFANLFKDKNMLTDFNTAKKILDNKDAVTGVAGAV